MKDYIRFGIPMPVFRTDYGTIRSKELMKISIFLSQRGLLISNYADRIVAIVHPDIVDDISEVMQKAGFLQVMIGSTLSNLRNAMKLTIAETRVLEAFTPGAIILESSKECYSVAVPDNGDLRDISNLYQGTLSVFVGMDMPCMRLEEAVDCLSGRLIPGINRVAILEPPLYEEVPMPIHVTVAQILAPGNAECIKKGDIDLEHILNASKSVSQWEIGEWR